MQSWLRKFKYMTCACIAVGVVASVPLAPAMSSKNSLVSVKASKVSEPLKVSIGKGSFVSIPDGAADVLVADTTIVDVRLIQSNKLYLVGNAPGDTNLLILDESGDLLSEINLNVAYDLQAINALVEKFFPNEAIEIGSIADQIYLRGSVSSPEAASNALDFISQYVANLIGQDGSPDEYIANMLEVSGEQQVMLKVKILEASRSFVRELGVRTEFNDPNELATSVLFDSVTPSSVRGGGEALALGTAGGIALPSDPAASLRGLFNSGIEGIGLVEVFLDALEDEDLLSVLAEPNLTTISGQQAGFLAGGEFPVPVGRDQVGNLVIEYREFGVSLNFKPVVMSEDRINLQFNTEVSSLDFTNSVGAGDIVVPGLDVRRAETTVEIPSGGTMMIGGLLQSENIKGMAGLPGVRNTPILGDLISSDSFERNETELVILVTAYMVKPFADESNVEVVSQKNSDALAKAFVKNMRKSFKFIDEEIFALDETFGYVLE